MNTKEKLTLNFGSRDSYVAFRKEWKAEYAQTSQDIRDAKNKIKNIQREGGYAGSQLYARLRRERINAIELLALLVDAKVMAQKQYLVQKEMRNVGN